MAAAGRILVIEDDERLAASLRRSLAYEGHHVRLARDGTAGLAAAGEDHPDVIVLDVMLPGVDGLEVCRRIRRAGDDVAILMVTARDTVTERVAGLDAGADDYLVKPFAHDELLARVRALLRRHATAADVFRFADLVLDRPAMLVRRAGVAIELTALEFRLLEHFVRNPRVVLSRATLLDVVWGLDSRTASNVVDVYVGYLRRKLEAGGGPRLIHAVRTVGYVLREPAGVAAPP